MAAGVAGGLQNRFGASSTSRVGSIPTRSRHFLRSLVVLFGLTTTAVGPAVDQEPDSAAVGPAVFADFMPY